jgi:septal ring factor EnvC (AmiA/AmiB activator)
MSGLPNNQTLARWRDEGAKMNNEQRKTRFFALITALESAMAEIRALRESREKIAQKCRELDQQKTAAEVQAAAALAKIQDFSSAVSEWQIHAQNLESLLTAEQERCEELERKLRVLGGRPPEIVEKIIQVAPENVPPSASDLRRAHELEEMVRSAQAALQKIADFTQQ